MQNIEFQITYDGFALEGHQMDAKDLAPALLGLSDLLEEANQIFNGNQANIQLNVKGTFKTGSFHIDFSVHQDVLTQVTNLFSNPSVVAGATLLAYLGFAKDAGSGLIGLLKKIRGRKIIKVTKTGSSKVIFQLDDEEIAVDKEILPLFKNIKIRKSLDLVINKPLSREGVESFKATINNQSIEIQKEEKDYFAEPVLDDEVLGENIVTKSLQLLTVNFVEGNKWRFSDGNNHFYADVKDEIFISKVKNGEERFATTDIFHVEIKEKQSLATSGIKTEYEIIKVISHRPNFKQISLPLDDLDRE